MHLGLPYQVAATPATASSTKRLGSVDVFRGAIIVGMVLVNAQFSPQEGYSEFAHAEWNGWTFADTV